MTTSDLSTKHIQPDAVMGWNLVSFDLWEMLRFHPDILLSYSNLAGALKATYWTKLNDVLATDRGDVRALLEKLRPLLDELELRLSVYQIDRIIGGLGIVSSPVLATEIEELHRRITEELQMRLFVAVSPGKSEMYRLPLKEWRGICDRFPGITDDAYDASLCFVFERYTACIFHLMKIIELAVIEMQVFLGTEDVKAHFGSVLSKLEDLQQKTKFESLPGHLKPYRAFLSDVLPQLHAVKDSWRNKVSHVESRLIPDGRFDEHEARGIYQATLLLMRKLANGLPPMEDGSIK